jgi:hypothetical protein
MPTESFPAFRPELVRVDPAQPGAERASWCIELDPDATVPEFVLLLIAFRCRAEIITGQTTRLVPLEPNASQPTPRQIAAVFEHGLEVWQNGRVRTELELVR